MHSLLKNSFEPHGMISRHLTLCLSHLLTLFLLDTQVLRKRTIRRPWISIACCKPSPRPKTAVEVSMLRHFAFLNRYLTNCILATSRTVATPSYPSSKLKSSRTATPPHQPVSASPARSSTPCTARSTALCLCFCRSTICRTSPTWASSYCNGQATSWSSILTGRMRGF